MPTIASTPLFMQANDYSAQDLRGLVAAVGDEGVLGAADLAVTQRAAGANMTVDVAVGKCIIPGAAGSYLCPNPSTASVSIDAAPGVGNSRIDVVYARIVDSEISGSDDEWEIDKVTGTASGSPSAPSLPSAYAIELARITLTSSTTSITDSIITNARRQSTGSSVWPLMHSLALGLEAVTGTAETWGTITVAAPNRPVRLFAVANASFACATTETNVAGELAIRTQVGSETPLTPNGALGVSPNEFLPQSVARSEMHTLTPGVGDAVEVSARIKAGTGTNANFDLGRLHVQVFPG